MGNLVVFRRDADPVPLELTNEKCASRSESKDVPVDAQAERPGDGLDRKSVSWRFAMAPRHFGLTGHARGSARTAGKADLDGYLLVLLADQELTAGRDMQAQALLDAAYAAFDRQAMGQPCLAARQ